MGKIEEIKEIIDSFEADSVLFNIELSGTHYRNLEEALQVKIFDRTMLILDIFARRAITKEGKLQVELAQYQYRLPRLAHYSPYLSRLGGGIGTRGPGETKLESDRRHIIREISTLKKKLNSLRAHRRLTRSKRNRSRLPLVSLLGYTNAGKSSILNEMLEFSSSHQQVEVKDMVFASLQPFTRRIDNPLQTFLMSDTVGFVSDLPTHLVAAFESSLEEIEYADVLIHVVDASSPQLHTHLDTVNTVLKGYELSDKKVITYFNKMDLVETLNVDIVTTSNLTLKGSTFNKKDMKKLFDIIIESVGGNDE